MLKLIQFGLFILIVTSGATAKPLYIPTEHPPLAAGLSSRVAAHSPRLQEVRSDPRLALPSPQELDAIKKVAQILVTLGEQVIPAIIGDASSGNMSPHPPAPAEVPNDAVESD